VATPPPQRLLDLARGNVGRRIAEARRNRTTRSIAREIRTTHGLSPRNWRTLQEYADEAWPEGAPSESPAPSPVRNCDSFGEVQQGANAESPPPPLPPRPSVHFCVPTGLRFGDEPDYLLIGDPHAEHGQDLWRFDALGRMINDRQPRKVRCVGDWATNEAPSRHSKAMEREGKRIVLDLAAGVEAVDRTMDSASRGQGWSGDGAITLGNHDEWPEKWVNDNPIAAGLLPGDLYGFERHGWKTYKFMQEVLVEDNIAITHFVSQPNSDRAIGGKNAARLVSTHAHQSVIFGHSHLFSHYTDVNLVTGQRFHTLNVGWFSDVRAKFAGLVNSRLWWAGLVELYNVRDGDFDFRLWSMDDVRRRYGKAA
jgi:hypothetical protein